MKIVHISTADSGGAGKAALRTSQALNSIGISSKVLCLHQNGKFNPEVEKVTPYCPSILKKILSRLGIATTNGYKQYHIQKTYKEHCGECFSLPISDYQIENHPLVHEADIIHLHWVSQFINYKTFFRKVQKPIVWTFHDMNPFLGGFHYQGDQERHQFAIENIDNKINQSKIDAVYSIKNISLVCPSHWIYLESMKRPHFSERLHHVVPNCVPTNIFRVQPQRECRERFGLPLTGKILLFVSESISNYRKGFDILLDAISLLPELPKITLATVGKVNPADSFTHPIKHLGALQTDEEMACAYSAADAVILTSREDNCPNVILESLSCGTPAICTPAGGIPELIQTGINGILSLDFSPISVKNSISEFITNSSQFQRSEIQNNAHSQFSYECHAKQLELIYKNQLL